MECPDVATSAGMIEGMIYYRLNSLYLGWLYTPSIKVFEAPEYYKNTRVINEQLVNDLHNKKKLFSKLHNEWGGLNVLCANAGIAGPTASVEETSLADWRRCVSVNLEGAFLFAKYAAPVMKSQKSGVIILTSSTAGLYGFMHRAPYVSAKWGVIGLMKTLAIELGPFNIRANAICPGGVEGDRLDRVIEREAAAKGVPAEEVREAYAAGTSMRHLVSATDIANMAVFLASDSAQLVSGQAIAVDGHTEHPEPKF